MGYTHEVLEEATNKPAGVYVTLARVQVNDKVRFTVTTTGIAWYKQDEDVRDGLRKHYHHVDEAEARKVFGDWSTTRPYKFVSSSQRQSAISRATGMRLA